METPIEQTSSFYLSDWHGSLGEYIWHHVLKMLEQDPTIGEWLLDILLSTSVISFSEQMLVLYCSSSFKKHLLVHRCVPKIRTIFKEHFLIEPDVVVISAEQVSTK